MKAYRVHITRRLPLVVMAENEADARNEAVKIAWEWQPEDADGGDQGTVSARVEEEAA